MKAKHILFAVLILSYLSLIAIPGIAETQNRPLQLMPIPASLEQTQGILRIPSDFRIATAGHSDSRLKNAVIRTLRRLQLKTGIPPADWTVQDRGAWIAGWGADGHWRSISCVRAR